MTFNGITIEDFEELSSMQCGVCIECGTERECCEPDARKYRCDECGQLAVYGAEELLFMGLVS